MEGTYKGICRAFFAMPNFFETTQEEIRNMNPSVALRTLKTFGFNHELYKLSVSYFWNKSKGLFTKMAYHLNTSITYLYKYIVTLYYQFFTQKQSIEGYHI